MRKIIFVLGCIMSLSVYSYAAPQTQSGFVNGNCTCGSKAKASYKFSLEQGDKTLTFVVPDAVNSSLSSNPPHNGMGNGRAYIVLRYTITYDVEAWTVSAVYSDHPTTNNCSDHTF